MLNTIKPNKTKNPIPNISKQSLSHNSEKKIDKEISEFVESFYNGFNNIDSNKKKLSEKVPEKIISDIKQRQPLANPINVIDLDKPKNDYSIMIKNMGNVFTIYDKNNISLGTFTIENIINYISGNKNNNDNLISNFIIKDLNTLELHDFTTSPLMGNIDTLLKLSALMEKHSKTYYDKIYNINNQSTILDRIKIFNYNLNTMLLKLLSNVGGNNINANSKINLIKYSVAIMNKITSYTKNKLDSLNDNNETLYNSLKMCQELRQSTNNKMSELLDLIKLQNSNISQKGGKQFSSTSNTHKTISINSSSVSSDSSNTTSESESNNTSNNSLNDTSNETSNDKSTNDSSSSSNTIDSKNIHVL